MSICALAETLAEILAETICALAETHLRGDQKAEMNGYEFLNSGIAMSASKTQARVGVAYDPAKVNVIDFAAVSEKSAIA